MTKSATQSKEPKDKVSHGNKVVIKKYANRRLYDTSSSSYVTLEDLCQLVKDGIDFVVIDAKSEEDLTRSVLTQIIFEQESKGYNILPIGFLRQIISFYDDSLSSVLPSYLEQTMTNFADNQEQMRGMLGGGAEFSPLKQFEELGKQNMEIFQNAMSMWNPFYPKEEDK